MLLESSSISILETSWAACSEDEANLSSALPVWTSKAVVILARHISISLNPLILTPLQYRHVLILSLVTFV